MGLCKCRISKLIQGHHDLRGFATYKCDSYNDLNVFKYDASVGLGFENPVLGRG